MALSSLVLADPRTQAPGLRPSNIDVGNTATERLWQSQIQLAALSGDVPCNIDVRELDAYELHGETTLRPPSVSVNHLCVHAVHSENVAWMVDERNSHWRLGPGVVRGSNLCRSSKARRQSRLHAIPRNS